jgi:hypothetical protein
VLRNRAKPRKSPKKGDFFGGTKPLSILELTTSPKRGGKTKPIFRLDLQSSGFSAS